MDLTKDFWYDKSYDPTINFRCYHKCYIPRNFKVIGDNDKEMRQHLFVMANNTVTMKVYDKIYELKKNDRCPESLKGKYIMRYEVSLKREAFLKKFNLNRKASLYDMLLAGYESIEDTIDDYLNNMFPFSGKVMRYEKAKKQIESNMKNSDLSTYCSLYPHASFNKSAASDSSCSVSPA